MSVYVCEHCGNYVDSDFDLPADDCGNGEVCPACAESFYDDDGNLIEAVQYEADAKQDYLSELQEAENERCGEV